MFDRIIAAAMREANISDQAFDAAIKTAGFKSRIDWFTRGASQTLVDAYNARVAADRTDRRAA
jgi:hypothetical protein